MNGSSEPSAGAAGAAKPSLRLSWVIVLRGFAALWVYAFHLWVLSGGKQLPLAFAGDLAGPVQALLAAGYQGIDLFFVLSGFVIAWPYVETRRQRLDRHAIADFYQRRFFRIAPIYYVSIVAVVVLVHLHWLAGTRSIAAILAHFLFVHTLNPEWTLSLLGVYWTLPTEMHFYLLFPLLLRVLDVERPLRFAAACIALAIAYRWFSVWSTFHAGIALSWTAAYLPGRIDQFACGMAAACLLARGDMPVLPRGGVVAVGLLVVAGLVLIGRHDDGLAWWFRIGPSLAAVLIAGFIVVLGRHLQARGLAATAPRGAVARAATRLGEASLGIYLWHAVFLGLAAEIARRLGSSADVRVMLLFASVPVTLAVSLWTYRLVEAPWVAFSRSASWRDKVARLVTRWWPRREAAGSAR